jgi:DNA polymerase V
MELYQRIMNKQLLARRINITANNIVNEEMAKQERDYKQIDLFTSYQEEIEKEQEELTEKELQKAMIDIKRKYGKNAILKGMNLQEGGTTIDRNKQIGGHHE